MMMSWQLGSVGTQLLRKKQKKCNNKTPKTENQETRRKPQQEIFLATPNTSAHNTYTIPLIGCVSQSLQPPFARYRQRLAAAGGALGGGANKGPGARDWGGGLLGKDSLLMVVVEWRQQQLVSTGRVRWGA
jgi:hypothetical protein